jgi:phosphate transport system protein
VSLARAVLGSDDKIDELEGRIIRDAIGRLSVTPTHTEQEIDLIFITKDLERVGDHATNIAEEVILAAEAKNLKHAAKLSGQPR